MHVKSHALFEFFLKAHAADPQESVVYSLAASPTLRDFLADLDPALSLDWSQRSFQGLPALREKVLARHGYRASVDDVLITAGTAEANFLAIAQRVGPGDELIVDVPGWPQPLVLGEAIGARVRRLERREESGWALDLEALAAMITPKTRLIFLGNPNNPTGRVLETGELEQVVEQADRVGAYVLCDEVYSGLEWDGRPTPRNVSRQDCRRAAERIDALLSGAG